MFSQYRLSFSYISYKALYSFQSLKLFLMFRLIDPLMHYLFFSTLASALLGKEILEFVLIGNVVYFVSQTVIVNFISMFRLERMYGTLSFNVGAPLSTTKIIFKKSLIPLLDGIIVLLISLVIVEFIFDINLNYANFIYLLIAFLILFFSLLSISVLLASFSLIFDGVNLYLNIVLSLIQVLCGINFPTTLFPNYIELISINLPITNGLLAIRAAFENELQNYYHFVFKELLIGTIVLVLTLILVRTMEKIAKKNGSLFKE